MDFIEGMLGLSFFIASLLPVPIYVFAGGSRSDFGSAGVHGGIVGIAFGLFGSLVDTDFFLIFLIAANGVMGYLCYFAAWETNLIGKKKESLQDYRNRTLREAEEKRKDLNKS